jgi:G3E family GTPase
MKVLIIAGFLGSGKTTLLLQIARRLSSASQRIVIIENEIGEVGVDGDYLDLEGLQVQELFGGCVCCTLSAGLIEALEKLNRYYHPDIVILEATGAANPGDIVVNVRKCRLEMHGIKVITLVDANRYAMLMEMMTPLLTSQIQAADIVAVNKIDLVKPEMVEQIIQDVGNLNPRAQVNAISLEKRTHLNILMDQLQC